MPSRLAVTLEGSGLCLGVWVPLLVLVPLHSEAARDVELHSSYWFLVMLLTGVA